jgi:hypothetical protein
MPDPHIITLRKPVGPKGKEITELRLREPRAGEVMRASRETGRGLALSLLMQVTGVEMAVIEALPGRVSDRAFGYLMTFAEPILALETNDTPEDPLDEMTITLTETLQIGTTWVTELNLREPTLGEMIKGDKYDGLQRTVVLVALVSGLPRAVIEMVPISEFAKAAKFTNSFTEAAPMSGGES